MLRAFLLAAVVLTVAACSNEESGEAATQSENEVDAARNFIRAALDGNYRNAANFVVKDSMNLQLLDALESNYKKNMDREEQRAYREASIRIADVRPLNDSASVVVYSNSYKNKQDSLHVVARQGTWLVDLKYTFLSPGQQP